LIINDIVSHELLWISMIIGSAIGYIFAVKVAMTQMPQLVALLNGFGGAASAIVAIVTMTFIPASLGSSTRFAAVLALAVGSVTFSGSMVAAAKLDRRISHLPVILKGHMCISVLLLVIIVLIRNTNPRLRIDQAMKFFWGPVTGLAILAVILAFIGI